MNQSTFIVGALLAAFALYLTAKGRLPLYQSVLWGATAAPAPSGGAPTSPTGGGVDLGQAASTAAQAASFLGL